MHKHTYTYILDLYKWQHTFSSIDNCDFWFMEAVGLLPGHRACSPFPSWQADPSFKAFLPLNRRLVVAPNAAPGLLFSQPGPGSTLPQLSPGGGTAPLVAKAVGLGVLSLWVHLVGFSWVFGCLFSRYNFHPLGQRGESLIGFPKCRSTGSLRALQSRGGEPASLCANRKTLSQVWKCSAPFAREP